MDRLARSGCLATTLLLLVGNAAAEDVTFTFVPPEGMEVRSVSLRGSFNGWGEAAMTPQEDGSWSVTIALDPGEHEYKYFINDEWPKDMETWLDGAPVDPEAEGYTGDPYGGQNALREVGGGKPKAGVPPRELAPAPPLEAGFARIHYHRPDRKYAEWGLHVWEDAEEEVTWASPLPPKGETEYGLYWDVGLAEGAAKVGFIVHKGDDKDPGPDMFLLPEEHGREVWLVSGSPAIHSRPPDVAGLAYGDLGRMQAHWVARDLIAWKVRADEGSIFRLHFAPEGGLKVSAYGVTGGEAFSLALDPAGLPADVVARFPHLARFSALRLSGADLGRAAELLKGQVAVSVTDAEDHVKEATGLQIPGVLDDLFAYDGPLGLAGDASAPLLALWAPTARSVSLHLFDSSRSTEPSRVVGMTEQRGVWIAVGGADWKRKYYLYEVEVYVPATGSIERNFVTDPYSRSLASNSKRSQIVDLDDPDLKPEGWGDLTKPPLEAPEEIVLYELHIRDFSANDPTVPDPYRGTFMAFAVDSDGTKHLRALAGAGLTHVHLLPAFDIATIDEEKSTWQDPGDLEGHPPDSEAQQAALDRVRDHDPYNWGYDPYHYGVPEGSYSTDPDGAGRIREFREMVKALSDMGLRVVMDVVYNHTHASGQDDRSVLDRIVPGYYHRLSADGFVETSTCCQNTATEHTMMERLMIDDLVHWATDYKVDGFRFDLMGHHMRRNMERARDALRGLAPESGGVDGSAIYLYGEGWDFGEVAGGARGANATQNNMAGTGIGTFNDRLRDAARGGNPFSDRREQGFVTGLYYDANGFNRGGDSDRAKLLQQMDRIRVGLAGNLKRYRFTAHTGSEMHGGQIDYAGYADDPQEIINYVSAHDNETMWDKIAYAAASEATLNQRVRMQNVAVSLVALGQGIPFFHAGIDMLRSKSLDADSYNSGDWFNRLDFSYASNNFGAGLPPAEKNRDRWGQIRPLLSRADLTPGREEILDAVSHFREMLQIRKSSPLFRLRTAEEIQARVRFHNTGPNQIPGLIVMGLAHEEEGLPDIDPVYERIVVLFNANDEAQMFGDPQWERSAFELHPVQAEARDKVVKGARFDASRATFVVPARTTAVFVER